MFKTIKQILRESNPSLAEGGMPSGVIRHKQKLGGMSPEELHAYFKSASATNGKPVEHLARSTAWRHGYGEMSSHYWDKIKHLQESNQYFYNDADEPYHHVEHWYDKHTRSWVVQKKDKEGNQVGAADYVGRKHEAESLRAEYEKKIVKEEYVIEGKLSAVDWKKKLQSTHGVKEDEIQFVQVGHAKTNALKRTKCDTCKGHGYIEGAQCTNCSGKGFKTKPIGSYHPRLGGIVFTEEAVGTVSVGSGAVAGLTDPTTNFAFQDQARRKKTLLRRKKPVEE